MQCLNCGAINSDDSTFCETCGQRMQPAPVPPQPIMPAPEVQPPSVERVSVQPVATKRRKIPWYVFALVAGVLVICLVVAGGLAYLIFRDTTSTIAYVVNNSEDIDPGLYLMDDDGQNARLLVPIDPDEEEISHLTWSPDGKQIAYTLDDRDGRSALCIVNVKTGEITHLVEDLYAFLYRFFDWSPDSSQIVYYTEEGDGELRIVNTDNSDDSALTEGAYPYWSPDGDTIAFTSLDADGDWDTTALIRPDGSEQVNLPEDEDLRLFPWGWSPDGKWIIAHERDDVNYVYDLWLISKDGIEQTILTDTPEGNDLFPSFSPNGRWIAYFFCEGASFSDCDIYIMRQDGTEQKRLARHVDDLWFSWSPDSSSLIYSSDDGEIILVEIASGEKTTLNDEAIYAEWPVYQP